MKEKWLYTINGKTLGPASAAKIADLVLKGEQSLDDSIQSTINGIWKPIRQVKDVKDILDRPLGKPLVKESTAQELAELVKADIDNFGEILVRHHSPILLNWNHRWFFLWNLLTLGFYGFFWMFRIWMYLLERERKDRSKRRVSMVKYIVMFFFLPYVIFYTVYNEPEFRKASPPPYNPYFLSVIYYLAGYFTYSGSIFNSAIFGYLLSGLSLGISSWCVWIVMRYINDCNKALGRS